MPGCNAEHRLGVLSLVDVACPVKIEAVSKVALGHPHHQEH